MIPRPARFASRALLLAAALSGPAAASDSETASGGGTTALILFVAYRGVPVHDFHPTWVRRTGSAVLAAELAEPGRPVVTYPELEAVLQRRRIRSNRDVDSGLVETLARENAADRIVVATLTMHRDRVRLVARGLRGGTGALAWADAVETEFPTEGWSDSDESRTRFREILAPGARALRVDWAAAAGEGAAVVVLPLRSEGTDRGVTDMVTACVLRSVLRRGEWSVPDPALTASAVRDGGFHPLQLEPGSRRLLAERFGARWLLVPRLLPFPVEGGGGNTYLSDDDEIVGPSFDLGTQIPFHLSVALIDCGSGKVVEAGEVYLAPENPTGIFGVTRRPPSVQRFERGADRAIASLFGDGGLHE